MTSVATRKTRLSAFVKLETLQDRNYCRSVETLTLAGEVEIGAVFNPADGELLAAADVAGLTAGDDVLWLLVDDRVYSMYTGAGDYDLAILKGGPGASAPVEVMRDQLKFADALSSGQVDSVVAVLNAQGIRVI